MQFFQVFLALLIETVSVLYHSLQAIELCKKNDTATKDEATSQSVSNAIIMIKWENNLIVLPDEQREVVGVNLQVHSPAPSSSLWTQPPLQHLFPVKGPKFYVQTIHEKYWEKHFDSPVYLRHEWEGKEGVLRELMIFRRYS